MREDTPILTDDKALSYVRDELQAHLPLHARGYKCTTETLIDVLVAMTSQGMTLEQACDALPESPHPSAVRGYLNEQITVEQLAEVENGVNATLHGQLPQRLWRKPLDVAVDVHESRTTVAHRKRRGCGFGDSGKQGHGNRIGLRAPT